MQHLFNAEGLATSYAESNGEGWIDQWGNEYPPDPNFHNPEPGLETSCPECIFIGGARAIVAGGYKLIQGVTSLGSPTYSTFAMGSTARNTWKLATGGLLFRNPLWGGGMKSPIFYWNNAGGDFYKAVRSLGVSNAEWNRRLIPLLPLGLTGEAINE